MSASTLASPALAIGYLVRCRIPLSDLQGMACPDSPPRFRDGYVRLDLEAQEAVLTWVNVFNEPKTVMNQRDAMELGTQMAQAVTRWLLSHNARYPVPTGLLLHA